MLFYRFEATIRYIRRNLLLQILLFITGLEFGLGKLRYHSGPRGQSGGVTPGLNSRFQTLWVKRTVFLTNEEKN